MIHNTHILGFLANGFLFAAFMGSFTVGAEPTTFKKIQEIVYGHESTGNTGHRLLGPTPPYDMISVDAL